MAAEDPKGRKILVVDDEPEITGSLQEILEQAGYAVETAQDGREALEKSRTFLPGLILLDVMMPKMDGFQVLEHLKKEGQTANIPVIMLTSRAGARDLEEGIQQHVEKYFSKPFDGVSLLAEIKKAFAVRRDSGAAFL